MSRSAWKSVSINSSLIKKHFLKKQISIFFRNDIVPSEFIGKKVYVYNGKLFINFVVTDEMVGYKFGEFAPTRERALHNKKSLKKKKK